jgi:hypothetical protein
VSLRSLAGGCGVGLAVMALGAVLPFPHYYTGFGLISPTEWPAGWLRLATNTWARLASSPWPTFLAATAGAGLLFGSLPTLRQQAAKSWRVVAVLVGTAVANIVLMCTLQWLKEPGDYDDRYAIPAVIMLQAAFVTAGVAPVFADVGVMGRRMLSALIFPALLFAAYLSYGFPSLAVVRADLDRTLGRSTDDIVDAGCTHVAGDYWLVWPRVFHANLVLRERGDHRVIWGVSYRSDVTQGLWKSVPMEQRCVAVPVEDDGVARMWLANFGFPELRVVETRPTVFILRP